MDSACQTPPQTMGSILVSSLAVQVTSFPEMMSCLDVYESVRLKNPSDEIPIVTADGEFIGLMHTVDVFQKFSSLAFGEKLGNISCRKFAKNSKLVFDEKMLLHEAFLNISRTVDDEIPDYFVVTREGKYWGLGKVSYILKRCALIQIQHARNANPLTLLPGNRQIQEYLQCRLDSLQEFYAIYWDLDFFKAYNDKYGYESGDSLILLVADILQGVFASPGDFIGHIGGDDFVTFIQGDAWEQKVVDVLRYFDEKVVRYFKPRDLELKGFVSKDRQGNLTFQNLTALSAGVVQVYPGKYRSSHQLALAMSNAKKFAKQQQGSSYFVERRDPSYLLDD
jgi:GGDEF domain-containing protein